MMLTNEIEHYIALLVSSNYSCNSGIILKLDKPKQKIYNAQFRWSTSYQLNCFIHLLIISAIFKEFMPHLTHKCYIFFQFAGDMANSHTYKFPQNNLYSYNMIAHNLLSPKAYKSKDESVITHWYLKSDLKSSVD
jgi:hypothetical protein